MLYEDLRSIHEDAERLEQAIADRTLEEPKHVSASYCVLTHPGEAYRLIDPQQTRSRPRNRQLPSAHSDSVRARTPHLQ